VIKKVILLGGQGDAASIGKAIVDAGRRGDRSQEFAGFLNDLHEVGSLFEGHPVLGHLEDAARFARQGYFFLNAVYRIDGPERRIARFEGLGISEDQMAIFVHPTAYVAPDVELSPGCVVMPNVCISPMVYFGRGCIVLQAATVGHNNRFGDYTHISAQACVGAHLKVGRGVHIGMNSTIRGEISMGDYSTLGAASLLLDSTGPREIWAGSPARLLRMARDE
jgi:acetyltransferase EpsM